MLACSWERKRDASSWPQLQKVCLPLHPLLLFFIRSTKIQSTPKHSGNPRTLPYHIPIFPQTWSLSEYLLWLTIIALIKAKQFCLLCLIYCFFFSPFHGMVSASHLSIKGKFIWQCAVTTLRTSSMLPMHTFRNHMLVYWTEVLRLECLDRRNKLLPIFWHRFQLYIINMCWNVFIRPQEAAETHWWKRGNIANSPHCRKTP